MFNLPKLKNGKKFQIISIDEEGEKIELKYNDGIILLDYSKGYFNEVTENWKYPCWVFFDLGLNQEITLKQIGETTYLLRKKKEWDVFDGYELVKYMEKTPFLIEIKKDDKEMDDYERFADPYKEVVVSSLEELDWILYPEY